LKVFQYIRLKKLLCWQARNCIIEFSVSLIKETAVLAGSKLQSKSFSITVKETAVLADKQ
jgi:hypothetical protein